MKNIRIYYLKIFILLVLKISVYLNRHFFVMSFLSSAFDYMMFCVVVLWYSDLFRGLRRAVFRDYSISWISPYFIPNPDITKTSLFKYTENFTTKSDKNPIFFLISAQNIDCGYSLEPSARRF